MTASISLTIGVFDSGFGGLTVLRELLPLVPGAHCIYLGDTARLPYGAKSQQTIARYAVESAKFLHAQGADLLVIACNTATALAIEDIRAALPIPVIGVIQPGVQAAHNATGLSAPHLASELGAPHLASEMWDDAPHKFQEVLVLATSATVQSHAYAKALDTFKLEAYEKACPLLVPLVEEGWTNHPVTDEVLRIYLTEALQSCNPTAVLLGCTHYPLIAAPIERTLRELGSQATVIDSARATARLTADHIGRRSNTSSPATFKCYATDSVEKFARLGSHFLGQSIPEVELLDLGG